MEVIVLKYVQLVCITVFMRNNCAQLMRQSEESHNLKVAACTADCLQSQINYVSPSIGNSNCLYLFHRRSLDEKLKFQIFIPPISPDNLAHRLLSAMR